MQLAQSIPSQAQELEDLGVMYSCWRWFYPLIYKKYCEKDFNFRCNNIIKRNQNKKLNYRIRKKRGEKEIIETRETLVQNM